VTKTYLVIAELLRRGVKTQRPSLAKDFLALGVKPPRFLD
jgi:hypothetical protein